MPWTATVIRSALDRHEPGRLAFHLLHDGRLPEADLARLETFVTAAGGSIVCHAVQDRRIDALRPPDSGSHVTWFRLIVPDLLPDIPRVLLIDSDTLIVDELTSLWNTDLEGAPLAAVANVVEPTRHDHVRSVGIQDVHSYLNAGVLLLDLEKLRAEGAVPKLLEFASENASKISWLDQDTLNVVFAGRWKRLHPRWNAMNSLWTWTEWANDLFGLDVVNEAVSRPAILHFEGPAMSKPWHYLSTHPWRDTYRATLARTPWADTPLDEDTVANHLISLLPKNLWIPAYWRWIRLRDRLRSRSA